MAADLSLRVPRGMEMSALPALLAGALAEACPRLFAISGAQGSGKSTLATRLQQALRPLGIDAGVVSLDDYYLSHAARQQLAKEIHPLLAQRGVPGTHQVSRLAADIDAQQHGRALQLPRFDKASDNPLPAFAARHYDLLIVEGWCLGALPQSDAQLQQPVNALDQMPAAEYWRIFQNEQLTRCYLPLWPRLQPMLMLQAPDWTTVCQWRRQQEQQLWRERGCGMTDQQLQQFMLPFQRWTEAMLEGQHAPAQYRLQLTADRRIAAIK